MSASGDAAGQFQTRKFSDVAQDVIRTMIFEGEFAPGERLNEIALSERLGVSRPPIREALQALSGERLVRMVAGKGAYVADFDPTTVQHLGEVRRALECAAARLAAERADAVHVEALRQAIADAEHALGDPQGSYPQSTDFHRLVVDAAGNPPLAETTAGINAQLRLARARSGHLPERAREALEEHRAVAEAIEQRDPERAHAAMRHHLTRSQESIDQVVGPTTAGEDPA